MTTSIPTIAPALIIALGGIILIWWLTGRPSVSRAIRILFRLVGIPAVLIVVGVALFSLNRARLAAAEAATPLVPSEQMTVQTGSLKVTLNATGALTPLDEQTLTFGTSALVTDVLVSVGDRVKAGDILAHVDTTTIDSQIASAQFSLTDAQNSLAALQEPPTDLDIKLAELQVQSAIASLSSASLSGASAEDIEIARLNVEQAKNSLYQAQLNRDMNAEKPGAGQEVNAYSNSIAQAASLASSDANVASAQNSYQAVVNEGPDASSLASGNASLMSAQAKLDSLLAGPSDLDVRQAEIKVETAQLAVDAAQQSLADATLVAPFDGVVASLDFIEGVPSSSGSLTLINTSGYTITLSVDEKDITQLQVGQPVSVAVQALDNAVFPGKVTHIDPAPVTSTSGQLVTYNVDVTLDPTDQPLRPGMSSIATVTLNQIDDVIVVPNRFITVDATTNQATVKVATAPGTYEDVPVVLGTRTDTESEITSGLTVGQTLVILPSASEASGRTGFGLFPGAGGGAFAGGERPQGGFGGGGGGATFVRPGG